MADAASDSTLLDLRGLRCPLPVLRVRKALAQAATGATFAVLADDPLAGVDVPNFVRENGDELVTVLREGSGWRFLVRRSAHPAEPA